MIRFKKRQYGSQIACKSLEIMIMIKKWKRTEPNGQSANSRKISLRTLSVVGDNSGLKVDNAA